MSEKTNDKKSIWYQEPLNISKIRERRNVKPEIMTEEKRKELDKRWKTTCRKPRTY
jgi:hypothetical protein